MGYAKIEREHVQEIRIVFVSTNEHDEADLEPLESGACERCHVEIESNVKYDVKCPLCGGEVWLT